MDPPQTIQKTDKNSMLVIKPTGKLLILFVPFRVQCIDSKAGITEGTWVYVDQVCSHYQHRILYLIAGNWKPYFYFRFSV